MDFRILGPLEVVDGGRPVSIRRGKEQALLAYLLLHANQVIPSERLIDELWGEQPPATAPKILQNAVSHLRKQLGDGRLLTRDPGYLLKLDPDELDANRFERLAKTGRPQGALALWRGTPLLELRDERFADDARRQLDEQHAATLEDRIQSDLDAGKTTELIPELEHLTTTHPLRERFHGQHMLALYRSGRQADALDAYQQARRTLETQLGLTPSPQLQHLQQQILNHDPQLATPTPTTPSQRPTPRRPRRATVLALAAALLAAAAVGLVFAFKGGSTALVVTANSVVAVDPKSNRIVGVTSVGAGPRGAAVAGNKLWVANSGDGTVSEVDPKTLKLVQNIGIGAQATEIATTPGTLWVATGLDNSLVKLDARSGGTLDRLVLAPGIDASAYAVASGQGKVWVISGDELLAIDPLTDAIVGGHRRLSCCGGLRDVAVAAGAVWVADLTQVVARISPAAVTPTATLFLSSIPTAITVGYGSIWVAASDFPRLLLWRINPETVQVTQTITLAQTKKSPVASKYGTYGFLATVDVAAGAGAIWATNYDDGTLIRIDPKTGDVTKTIHIGQHPRGIAIGANRVWVTVN